MNELRALGINVEMLSNNEVVKISENREETREQERSKEEADKREEKEAQQQAE
jgi:hypothetical protein